MMNKKLIGVSILAATALTFVGCGSDSSTASTADAGSSAAASSQAEESSAAESSEESAEETDAEVKTENAADGVDGGFTEYPIFEDEEAGFLNVSAVYFQPVPMSGGNENIEDFNIHLEADVSALENKLGFGVGDWVPYMTVDYRVIASDGSDAAKGSFMVMSASDGPHYGANIKLPNADTYSIEFTFHSPEENGYLIHLDDETGPGGKLEDYFGDGPLVLELKDVWDYVPQEW